MMRRSFDDETALPRGSVLVLAVSGGPDSTALLHATARLSEKLDLRLHAHGVDHGLRQEASHELEMAASLAARLEVPWTQSTLAVAKGGNVQARAREARWSAL